ncbi:hypothetical protein SKAU_G00160060 [Synaphobranchus kaupii]|uniref:Uncharacterized protein n=1 Tax=Synaphobranchus kaupii TaxID=118154 RepID=A0A9Q1FIH3_SYNKA|nr:hypothetical protein SKAU_G00160060 [Synaphobranchus kaupii]
MEPSAFRPPGSTRSLKYGRIASGKRPNGNARHGNARHSDAGQAASEASLTVSGLIKGRSEQLRGGAPARPPDPPPEARHGPQVEAAVRSQTFGEFAAPDGLGAGEMRPFLTFRRLGADVSGNGGSSRFREALTARTKPERKPRPLLLPGRFLARLVEASLTVSGLIKGRSEQLRGGAPARPPDPPAEARHGPQVEAAVRSQTFGEFAAPDGLGGAAWALTCRGTGVLAVQGGAHSTDEARAKTKGQDVVLSAELVVPDSSREV